MPKIDLAIHRETTAVTQMPPSCLPTLAGAAWRDILGNDYTSLLQADHIVYSMLPSLYHRSRICQWFTLAWSQPPTAPGSQASPERRGCSLPTAQRMRPCSVSGLGSGRVFPHVRHVVTSPLLCLQPFVIINVGNLVDEFHR